MFSKVVLAFLAIGALWVNVSAIPIPTDPDFYPPSRAHPYIYPPDTEILNNPVPPYTARPIARPLPSTPQSSINRPLPPVPVPGPPRPLPSPPPKAGPSKGELPQSFSALSYRDLTFVFSVVVEGLRRLPHPPT